MGYSIRLRPSSDSLRSGVVTASLMEAMLIGSGWHPSLFRAEMSALCRSRPWRLGPRTLIIESDDELLERLSRSASVDEYLSPFGLTSEADSLEVALAAWLSDSPFGAPAGRSIAVRWSKRGGGVDGVSGKRLAHTCGGNLSDQGWMIDLDDPDEELLICLDGTSGHVIWGRRALRELPRAGWTDRVPTERPFFRPVSLDPRLARLALNLVDIGEAEPLCDPMSGTGGVVMEGCMLGISMLGVDLDEEMVEGARANLDWLDESGESESEAILLHGDATDLKALLESEGMRVSGFVFDPPYGRNAWKSDDAWTLFTDVLASCRCSPGISAGSELACFLPWPPGLHGIDEAVTDSLGDVHGRPWTSVADAFESSGWRILSRHAVPVHGSLARLLVHAQAF